MLRVWDFATTVTRAGDLLNPDAIGAKFGSADVYDGSSISLTSDRIPGTRWIADTNNDRRRGKCVYWKGPGEVNCAELNENPDEMDNNRTQNEFGNWGDGEYRDNRAIGRAMYGTQVRRLIPQSV